MAAKLSSLTIFFPFYNDAGTVGQAIADAYRFGREVTNDLEVIAIHGGPSKDNTPQEIQSAQKTYPQLVILEKSDNQEGYAVIKHGFKKAKKEWVFYTDGDLQYHLDELAKLVLAQQKKGVDIVNGYKKQRADNFLRVFLGSAYRRVSVLLFRLPIRDTDCDFRLIRRSSLTKIALQSKDSSVLPELIKKLQLSGAKFAEIPVKHYPRVYGKSNYTFWRIVIEKMKGDFRLWCRLRQFKKDQ